MKKFILRLGLLMALPLAGLHMNAAVKPYDPSVAISAYTADEAGFMKKWMSYLPDDVFVAHVSIPGTHDTATAKLGSIYQSSSQTQSVDIQAQLDGGVRAFDIRPGLKKPLFGSATLNCNHGVATTDWTMDAAFTTLTNYLKNNPGEFFVIHFFRSNVESTSSDKNTFISLWNTFYRKYKSYFVDYNPYLTVGQVRGKIILLCRESLDFIDIPAAGKLLNWPWDEEEWNGGRTSIMHGSDPDLRGVIRVSDVSSPKNDEIFERKKNGIQNIYDWLSSQPTPNDQMRRDGYYQPDWAMCFTSAEYGGSGSGRSGYLKAANKMNQIFTDMIQSPAKKGPCGIVLSDWVLTDSYSNTQVYGKALIPAIAKNNFDYIKDYILDDELFTKPSTVERIWDESKDYFMRNVGTGNFLASGQWWGTHSVTANHGIKVTPKTDDWGKHYFRTQLSNNGLGKYGTLGTDIYVDNYFFPQYFKIQNVGENKYVFLLQDGADAKALGAAPINWEPFERGGITHTVDQYTKNENDPLQQWELISVDDYYQEQINKATMEKGSDISFVIKGGRFFGNDFENNEDWTFTGGGKAYKENPGIGPNDSQRVLSIRTDGGSGSNWTLKKEVKGLPEGVYTLRWKAYGIGIDDVKMTVNGKDISSQFKKGDETMNNFTNSNSEISGASKAAVGAEMASDDFTCSIEKFEINDGDLIFNATTTAHDLSTISIFDDFELIYYGLDYENKYPILYRTIKDAKRRLDITEDTDVPEWLQTYIDNMRASVYPTEDGGAAPALEIYLELRKLTVAQKTDDNKMQDFTNVLINAGFETGTMMGWTTSYEGDQGADTGVRPTVAEEYAMEDSRNSYLFHTAQNGRGTILSQTIPGPAADPSGLPAGHYRVTAQAANDENNYMVIDVNGQRPEKPIKVESASGASKFIDFEFDVAENTEEITISFMGANEDGSSDDFGGAWYKLDDVHIYREGQKQMCAFFTRLKNAIERANEIAAITLKDDAPEYYAKWEADEFVNKLDQIIKEHIENGHDNEDPLGGSNGLAEMTELFAHLAAVATSQTKTGSNMSAAIRNNSFELGDLTYWDTKAAPEADATVTTGEGDYNIAANSEDASVKKDLKYFYHSKHDDGASVHAYPIYQTITGLPAGYYKLTAFVASDNGNQLVLAANDEKTIYTVKKDNEFEKVEVEFEITPELAEKGGGLKLGLYPTFDGSFAGQTEEQADTKGPWYAVDNFDLRLVGRDVTIKWEMETDTHGTIILPFDVEGSLLEEYGLTIHSVFEEIGDPNAVGADYRLIRTQQESEFHANTPYLVIRDEASQPETQKKSIRSARAANDNKYEFSGKTSNEEYNYSPEGNLLIGTLVKIKAEGDQHHISQDNEGNIEFKLHDKGVDHPTVEPYHAYIKLDAESADSKVEDLFLDDPTHSLTWTREGQYYGTIMLPFDADVPEGMKAYTLTSLGEVTDMPNKENGTYQLLTLTEVENHKFTANTPYMVIMDSVEETTEPEEQPEVQPESYKLTPAAENATQASARYTFTGKAKYNDTSYSAGLLTGVHNNGEVSGYVLSENGKEGGFTNIGEGRTTLEANHAYIPSDHELNPQATYLLLATPQADTQDGVEEILIGSGMVDIYTLQGVRVARSVAPAEGLRNLAPGIYVLRSEKASVKVIKK